MSETETKKTITPIDQLTAAHNYLEEQACRKARALLESYRQSADLNAVERAQRAQQAITKAAQESR